MDNRDLINVLESLLGPAVAGSVSVPSSRSRGARGTQPPARLARDSQGPSSLPAARGAITSLLSAEMPVGLALLDARTLSVSRANASLLALLGGNLAEYDVVGRPLHEIAPGFAGSDVEEAFWRVARTGQPFSAIVEEQLPSGSIFRRCSVSAIRRPDGSFSELLLTLLDVTDQMEARQRADYETQRAEERAMVLEEQAQRSTVRSFAVHVLGHMNDLYEALARIAERTAEILGDCCAVFLLGEDDILDLATLYHRDRGQSLRLRSGYAGHPLRRGEGILGQVVLSGDPFLGSQWSSNDLGRVAAAHHALLAEARIESMICVPLREAARTFGVLVLFSTGQGMGSRRTYAGADMAFLQELADQIAQAAQNVRLREALRTTQAEKDILLEICTEGIAIYDAQGRLRHLNPAGRTLLSRPVVAGMERAPQTTGMRTARVYYTPNGVRLEPGELPWARALRGERVGESAPEPLMVEWPEGIRRTLAVRAMPVEDEDGNVAGAVVTLIDPSGQAGTASGEPLVGAQPGTTAGAAEWARWRETMELLDDGVVLCNADGTPLFVNTAGRALLSLKEETSSDGNSAPGNVWQHVRRLDGSLLPERETPAALALAGLPVHALVTSAVLPDGGLRRIVWDARRIATDRGDTVGVVLIARPATEATLSAESGQADRLQQPAGQPVDMTAGTPASLPHLPPALAPTTLLPGRAGVTQEPTTLLSQKSQGSCDLAEVCARVARGHGSAQGRRLEIRLPRKRVMVQANEKLLEDAVHALIASGVAVLPPPLPLHVAVWVERGQDDESGRSAVPRGVGVEQINTVLLKPGEPAGMVPPTRLVPPKGPQGQFTAVAVVRVCSPGLGKRGDNTPTPLVEPEEFARCRDMVAAVGGRAWAREDPLLGPTYSISVPLAPTQ